MAETVQLSLKVGEYETTVEISRVAADSLFKQVQNALFSTAVAMAREGQEPPPLSTWYVVNKFSDAVPYASEIEARAAVARRDELYPFNGPHVVRRMVDAS